MSRQVAIGGVIGFAVTVLLMAMCQKNEPAAPSSVGGGPTRVDTLVPVDVNQPSPRPRPLEFKGPPAMVPAAVRPLNLEGFDAGGR